MASNGPPAAATENTPLLPAATGPPSPDSARPPRRNVTFNPNPVTKTIEPEAAAYQQARVPHHQRPFLAPSSPSAMSAFASAGPPMLSALNNKLRRRNSHGGVSSGPGGGLPMVASGAALPKIGPQRSTKNAQKLKLLPNPELEADVDEESGRDVYSQYTRIKDPTARRDAARLGKADRDRLPRVTAYCTANKYQMDGLLRFLKGRGKGRGANAKLIDECIYTPYSYAPKQAAAAAAAAAGSSRQARLLEVHSNPERRHSTGNLLLEMPSAGPALGNGLLPAVGHESVDDLGMAEEALVDDMADEMADFDIHVHTPEVFLFDYGVVVIWGMTAAQEQRFLKEIAKFEVEKLGPDDVETERFNFYYTREYQARIYNDFITLRDKNNYMTKLAISHALAQSVKVRLPCPLFTLPHPNLFPDIPLRRTHRLHHRHLQRHPGPPRPDRHDRALARPDQHADRRAVHPAHQHPPQRVGPGHPRAVLGRAAARACLPGRAELPRDGPEGGVDYGETGCHCGFVGRAEGAVESWAWGEVGVDW